MANEKEKEIINYFKENLDKKEKFIHSSFKYNYYIPLKIQKSCLNCHGAKEDAPEIIRNN